MVELVIYSSYTILNISAVIALSSEVRIHLDSDVTRHQHRMIDL